MCPDQFSFENESESYPHEIMIAVTIVAFQAVTPLSRDIIPLTNIGRLRKP
jgi:hypothetical protein